MKKLVLAIMALLVTAHCGKAPLRWGGIVDNGNKPIPPSASPDGASPINLPALMPTLLFAGKYSVILPRDFALKSKAETKEEYLRGTEETLIFEEVSDKCQDTSIARNQHGIDIFTCDNHTMQFQGSNLEILQLSHKLDSDGLKIISDSMTQAD